MRLPTSASPTAAPTFGLNALDQRAVTAFAVGDVARIVEEVRERAEALASAEGDAARRRVISRSLAIAQAQAQLLEAALGQAFGRRDVEGARLIDQLLKNATARLKLLLDEHRAESGVRRNVVVIGNAENVLLAGSR